MLQTFVRCIKLGEILLDENRRLLVFCTQCQTDYDLNDFPQHLEYCRSGDTPDGHSLQGIFDDNVSFVFPVSKKGQESRHMLARYVNNNGKEFHVYKCNGIKRLDELQQTVQCKTNTNDEDLMDLIKIEKELLDPRWYTELSSTQNAAEHTIGPQPQSQQKQPASYHELVEAVTPFVHFKENFKTNNDNNRKIVKPNIKETPRMKGQILNGVNVPGRTLNKPNAQSSNFTVQSYVITKPLHQTSVTTKTATNMASQNNGNKSIKPAVSNNNNTNYNKQVSGNNNNVKSPGAKISSVKKLPNTPTVMSSNNKIKPETGNNSFKRPADSNKNCSNQAANSTINSMKLSVDKYRLKLPLLKQITAPNLPASNTAPTNLTPPTTLTAPKTPPTPATLQQSNRSTAATIKTDNQHNRKTNLKRTNESPGGSSSAPKQLKPSGCGSSAAGNPAAKICTLKIVTTEVLPGKAVQTQQILNKLQNLGLQVKIKEPASKEQKPSSTSTKDPEKERTLQIIKKLQSKGMNVKIIQPSKQAFLSSSSVENSHQPDAMQKRKKLEASVSNGQPPPMKRNLIIKKLN